MKLARQLNGIVQQNLRGVKSCINKFAFFTSRVYSFICACFTLCFRDTDTDRDTDMDRDMDRDN
jgi:hypothetical protein